MPSLSLSVTMSGLGNRTIAKQIPRESDGGICYDPTIPHGYAGELTTRTDNNTGEVTMEPGHGITPGMVVDIYWDGGVQYGVTVGASSTDDLPIDGGVGDNLPTQGTEVIVSPVVEVNVAIDGDELSLLGIQQQFANLTDTSPGHIAFRDGTSSLVAAISLDGTNPQTWDIGGGAANPFTGNPITKALCSNGSTENDCVLVILGLQDSTPS